MKINEIKIFAKKFIAFIDDEFAVKLKFDKKSVNWVDKHINELRKETMTKKGKEGYTTLMGSFFGECLIKEYGGKWMVDKDGHAILFKTGHKAFPFSRVHKQFELGEAGSILTLFNAMKTILKS